MLRLSASWALPGTLTANHVRSLEHVLDETERARALAFVQEADRRAFVVAHAMLRFALSAHAPVAPDAWRFATSPTGKPELAAPFRAYGLALSLSHTRTIVACCVSRIGAVGVDVEEVEDGPPEAALVTACCATSERALLARAEPGDAALVFARLWTIKEAVVKARGFGTDIRLDRVVCGLDPARMLAVPGGGAADRWEIDSLRPTPVHVLALARIVEPVASVAEVD